MNELQFKRLVSVENLTLAWRRVSTASNYGYKRFFRPLFYTYELAADANLLDLHNRLVGGSYEPSSPSRVYLPKASGLQRGLTLLKLEDQIVFQALANAFAERVRTPRQRVVGNCVFSNQPNADPNGIFFLQDWRVGYRAYLDQIRKYFDDGFRWVAHFDLAAFYDTISHELLFRTAFPKLKAASGKDTICAWLEKWSTPHKTWPLQHGIPQGPMASDFLAEVFLLPLDERMGRKHRYVRYVDDIRLFGKTELEVQTAVRDLEILCRDRGLIPQGKKFAITQVSSPREALGALPSIPPANDPSGTVVALSASRAELLFDTAISGRPKRIEDKTRARFVLFRGPPSSRLRTKVLKLMPRHPEHIDAIVHYLKQFKRSTSMVRACVQYLKATPYIYVRGELFQLLAPLVAKSECRSILDEALAIARDPDAGVSAKWGAIVLLCRAEELGFGRYSRFLLGQPGLVQALAIPTVPKATLFSAQALKRLLERTAVEPGLALCDQIVKHRQTLTLLGVTEAAIPSQVRNVLFELGVIPGKPSGVDPMAEILHKRYGLPNEPVWRGLLGGEYLHALQQLTQAEKLFNMGRSQWLNYQNSFNNAAFLALQLHLNRLAIPGASKTVDRNGKLIKFGVLLDAGHPFAVAHPLIAGGFRAANDRRNKLPSSHPYDEKTRVRNRALGRREQDSLTTHLATAYQQFVRLCLANKIK
jgi:hypothetical protein